MENAKYEADADIAIDKSIQRVLEDVLRCHLSGNTIRKVFMEICRIGYQRLDGLDIWPYKLFEISVYLEEFFGPGSQGLGCAFVRHQGANIKTIFEESKAKILQQIGE